MQQVLLQRLQHGEGQGVSPLGVVQDNASAKSRYIQKVSTRQTNKQKKSKLSKRLMNPTRPKRAHGNSARLRAAPTAPNPSPPSPRCQSRPNAHPPALRAPYFLPIPSLRSSPDPIRLPPQGELLRRGRAAAAAGCGHRPGQAPPQPPQPGGRRHLPARLATDP